MMITNQINLPITVILIDDHPVVRDGYRRLLETTENIRVVAEAADGETGYVLYRQHTPDIVILDLNMTGIDGFETMRRIKAYDPAARILVFSMVNNETLVQRVLKAGAAGYITKQCGAKLMIQAVYQVKSGKIYIEPELALQLATNLTVQDTSEDPLNALSNREFQIFKLMAEGKSTSQIATIISISAKTVSVHHSHVMKKLKLENMVQLVRLAMECRII